MAFVAFFIRGPMGLIWFRRLNPYYLETVVPKLFPFWVKNFTNAKRTITSTFIDMFIL